MLVGCFYSILIFEKYNVAICYYSFYSFSERNIDKLYDIDRENIIYIFFYSFQTEMKELADNNPGDYYSYVVTVDTGYKIGAGTSANINFVISGAMGDSGVRHLTADTKTVGSSLGIFFF